MFLKLLIVLALITSYPAKPTMRLQWHSDYYYYYITAKPSKFLLYIKKWGFAPPQTIPDCRPK